MDHVIRLVNFSNYFAIRADDIFNFRAMRGHYNNPHQ